MDEEFLLDKKDIKSVINILDAKYNNIKLFVFSCVVTLLLIIFSLLPIFAYNGMLQWVVNPESIFSLLFKHSVVLFIVSSMSYLVSIILSLIVLFKNLKYSKYIQMISIIIMISTFIVSLIVASIVASKHGFILFLFR